MYQLNDQTGEITIEFPDFGTVTIKHLKFGAYRRIRAERQRVAQDITAQITALPDLPPIPTADDASPEASTERARLVSAYQERLLQAQDLQSDGLARIWRFILLGDESFAGVATPKPPDDTDDWPAELFVDTDMLEAVMVHMGKARRSPSGPTQNGSQAIQNPLVAP